MAHARLVRTLRASGDDGFTLIEMMIALLLIALVAAGFLSATTTSISAARTNEGRTQAVQLAQDRLEQVVSQPWSNIGLYATDTDYRATTPAGETTVALTKTPRPASVPTPTEPVSWHGINYSIRTDITWQDDPNDGLGGSDADGNTKDVKHVTVTVSWTQNGVPRSVTVDDLRSATATEVPPSGASPLTVTVSAPTTQTLKTTGYLDPAMTITATSSKVATSATLSFTTRAGGQTVSMTSTNGTTWTATLPTSTGPFDTGLTTFGVSVSSTSYGNASGNAQVSLVIGTAGPALSVTAAPSQTLTSTGSLSSPISITATGTTSISGATVTYATHAGSTTRAMAGSGTSWTFTVPADSTVFDAGQETFTVQASFANNTSGTGLVTISLFSPILLPSVVSVNVNDPFSSTGLQNFCISSKTNTLYSATDVVAVVSNVSALDTVRLTAPNITTQEFPMSYVKTNTDGSMTFHYSVPSGQQFPNASSIVLKVYALKTISGTQYRDDYITDPAPTIESESRSSSCR